MTTHITEADKNAVAAAIFDLMGDPPSVTMRLVYRRLVIPARLAPEGCTVLPDDPYEAMAGQLLGKAEHELILGPASTPAVPSCQGAEVIIGTSIFPACAPGADAQVFAVRAYGSTGISLWETRDVPGVIGAQADDVLIRWDSGGLSIGGKR